MIEKPTLRELSPTQPGPRVPDHEMLRCIGRGSYGEVWLARSALGTYRAIKVVFLDNFDNPRPFEREYTGIRKYEPVSRGHAGLVDILQVGRNDAEGWFYYVMELADNAAVPSSNGDMPGSQRLPGADMGILKPALAPLDPDAYVPRTLSQERTRRGRIPARDCIALGVSLSGALAELHRTGLIHRDIKPSNIIFVGGVAKLADIGLVTDAAEPLSYVGTEGFIPPEGPNAPQADIFSLGKVLYEIAMDKDRLDFPEPATALEELPDRDMLIELNSILLKACQPDRRKRYATAAEMHAELELLHRGKSIRARRNSQLRVRYLSAAGVVALAMTVVALGVDRVLDWRTRALQGQSSIIHPSLVGKIAPRPASMPDQFIDLSPAYTAPLTEKWYPGPTNNTLSALPRGLQMFGGTQFDVRGLVQLAGGEITTYGADAYPKRVRDIFIGRWVQRLHFLQGAIAEATDGAAVGHYRIYFNTGRAVDVPVTYGRNIRSLWQGRENNGGVSNAAVAWSGQNPFTQSRGLELRLYHFTWDNPWPAEEVVAMEFNSAMTLAAPFLVALTAEDAHLSADQKKASVSLINTLQDAARSFPTVPVRTGMEPFEAARLKLNEHPVEIGGRSYDGFRFTTPDKESMDLVWSFSPGRTSFQGWFILPTTGGLKVGFEDWYHGSPPKQRDGSQAGDFVVQFLSGKKLQPGREYFIWFGSDTNQAIHLQASLRFVPTGSVDPNKPRELAQAVGLTVSEETTYIRHFCLGAIR